MRFAFIANHIIIFYFVLKGAAKFSKIFRLIVLNKEFPGRNDGKEKLFNICNLMGKSDKISIYMYLKSTYNRFLQFLQVSTNL